MFKKVFQTISKSLNKQGELPPRPAPAGPPPTSRSTTPTVPEPPAKPAPQKAAAAAPPATPEGLLGIENKMSKDQIRDRLKLLYRRYNRAASSLDNATRAEADKMLDAIVAVREKNFGEI